jgi:hypothetical protein
MELTSINALENGGPRLAAAAAAHERKQAASERADPIPLFRQPFAPIFSLPAQVGYGDKRAS